MGCSAVIGRKVVQNDRLLLEAIAGPDPLRSLPLRLIYSPLPPAAVIPADLYLNAWFEPRSGSHFSTRMGTNLAPMFIPNY